MQKEFEEEEEGDEERIGVAVKDFVWRNVRRNLV